MTFKITKIATKIRLKCKYKTSLKTNIKMKELQVKIKKNLKWMKRHVFHLSALRHSTM